MKNYENENQSSWTVKRIVIVAVAVIAVLFLGSTAGKYFENIPAGEIVVIQHPIDGDLMVYTSPGMVPQNWGKVTHYKKSFQLWFSNSLEQGATKDESIKIRFNDGGHAAISGFSQG